MSDCTEYVIIGAGPAAICAIPALLNRGVLGTQIVWVDAGGFHVGDFGSSLSKGSSVPGNTSVESYQKVNFAIYKILSDYRPSRDFLINNLSLENTCPIKIAAEPMQDISDYLQTRVKSLHGVATDIFERDSGLDVVIKYFDNSTQIIKTKKCILATGAKPKSLYANLNEDENKDQNGNMLTIISDPNTVFIKSELQQYLNFYPEIKNIAVVGSSHSAALAVMNLLELGVNVKQFMNKPYKFAETCFTPDGIRYTKYDNTGLKGEVASYTKNLLLEIKKPDSLYYSRYKIYLGTSSQDVNLLIEKNISPCTHLVAAIGYEATISLKINNKSLDKFQFNHVTTEFSGVKNLFGIGIAFPQQVISVDGMVELAVGYLKFWHTVNSEQVQAAWGA